MKKVVISIPVHEEHEVIRNHLHNIRKFCNCYVVIHVSGDSPQSLWDGLKHDEKHEFTNFLIVNEHRINTHSPNDAGFVTGLSTVHSLNFKYAKDRIPFDVFALETSNDMFVRKGINEVFDKYDCGFSFRKDTVENNKSQDCWLNLLRPYQNLKWYDKGPQEGSFYPMDVFDKVSDIVLNKIGGRVAGEEGVLPVLAFNICPSLYDNAAPHYVFHNASHSETSQEDILKVRNGSYEGKYAVKRVPRRINNDCRRFINNLTQND